MIDYFAFWAKYTEKDIDACFRLINAISMVQYPLNEQAAASSLPRQAQITCSPFHPQVLTTTREDEHAWAHTMYLFVNIMFTWVGDSMYLCTECYVSTLMQPHQI